MYEHDTSGKNEERGAFTWKRAALLAEYPLITTHGDSNDVRGTSSSDVTICTLRGQALNLYRMSNKHANIPQINEAKTSWLYMCYTSPKSNSKI